MSKDSQSSDQLSVLIRDFKALVPQLAEQNTSIWRDLRNRPGVHFNNVAGSPAVNFGLGNTLYAGFIGSIAGMDIGPTGAASIQMAITLATAVRQVVATYNGDSLAAPFRIQAAANSATALLFFTNAATDAVQGQWHSAAMMVLPVATFASWSAGHWQIANFLDRLAELQLRSASDEEIANDPLVRKFEKRFLALYGTADIVAPWKNMRIDEVADTLARLASEPMNLTKAQLGSAISLPFFIGGLTKTFAKNSIGSGMEKIEGISLKAIPEAVQKALGMEKGLNPNHYYMGGYGAGAAFALASGQYIFAAGQAFWSKAYGHIASGRATKPISADEYIKEIARANTETHLNI
jgi:hypothetical protein